MCGWVIERTCRKACHQAQAEIFFTQHKLHKLLLVATVFQEHVRQSLPAVLQSRGQLQQTAAEAADATYAANHSREFGRTMRTALPASLHRLEGCLRDASWTASEISRQQKEVRGGASSSSSPWGGWVPARLRGLWLGNSSGQSGSNAMYDHF
jgi:hypothetical protein